MNGGSMLQLFEVKIYQSVHILNDIFDGWGKKKYVKFYKPGIQTDTMITFINKQHVKYRLLLFAFVWIIHLWFMFVWLI